SLESVIENKTGVFFDEQTVESLIEALKKFENTKFEPKNSIENSKRFSKEIFLKNFKQTIASL
ncbi:MAG: Glycosyl transferase group 1, partial [Microgenomates group bacterium Gr01-1014_93]